MRDALLVILAVATGATDATAFEHLGHVFASVVTGNLILLGISAVSHGSSLALFCGCALAGYALGVFLAAPRGERDDHVWPVAAARVLGLDLALLVVFAVGWVVVDGRPGHSMQVVLLALAAGAMGMQSSAVRRLGQMSTTYLTGTLTGVVESIAARRWSATERRSFAIIVSAVAGAVAATLILRHARLWLPSLQILPLLGVLVGSRRLMRRPGAG
jgi:uncharacterized membrane protein YoaK (UPF0700 family)